MDDPPSEEVTDLLLRWRAGDESALHQLMPLVQRELKKLARRYMSRERPGHTLQTTALVNELYLRLIRSSRVKWQDRAHFLAVSADLMRRVLIDWARGRRSVKRGGDFARVSLDETNVIGEDPGMDLVAVDDALTRLAEVAPRQARVIELRFYGGLTIDETAEAMGVSPDTVKREWRTAKVWLRRALDSAGHGPHPLDSNR